ncbi:hypothetical protein [Streptomyces caeruleatus]|uniref:Transposase (putative) YhgA-like domain-containing protein n=1 Tax=Streptomyces caeruleatus TaxID=661399 RepID=A0A101TLR1_9ACTN|nr:hypothetical protein [Streptomyces caeruleatus]KUN94525.1 hypothetical protein AQJ67_36990 [Streptomyces caeruleatus]
MVNSPHEAMHRIFQEYPGLFTGVSRALGLSFSLPTSVTVLPTDLTEARPIERRVDTLLRFDCGAEGPLLLLVESQGAKDPDKPASWAYYLTYLYAKYKIPPLLLVVCQDRATAEWAARPVPIGPVQWPSLTLRPLVAGPHNMPVITDPDEARSDLALATLSAITHAKEPVVDGILKALSAALRGVPEAVVDPIIEFTAQGIGGNRRAAELWRNLVAVDLSFYKSWLSEEIRDEGREQGREQGRAQSRAEDILLLLDRRGIGVSDANRERITSCADLDTLGRWFERAITASSTEEIFADE